MANNYWNPTQYGPPKPTLSYYNPPKTAGYSFVPTQGAAPTPWQNLWRGILGGISNSVQWGAQGRPGGVQYANPNAPISSKGQSSLSSPFPQYGPQQGYQRPSAPSPWLQWLGQNGLSQFGMGFYQGTPGRTYANGTTQPNTMQVVAPGPYQGALPSQGPNTNDQGGGYGGNQFNNYYGGGGGGNNYTPAAAQWYQAMTNWRV